MFLKSNDSGNVSLGNSDNELDSHDEDDDIAESKPKYDSFIYLFIKNILIRKREGRSHLS